MLPVTLDELEPLIQRSLHMYEKVEVTLWPDPGHACTILRIDGLLRGTTWCMASALNDDVERGVVFESACQLTKCMVECFHREQARL
jgi:hypothetical protein